MNEFYEIINESYLPGQIKQADLFFNHCYQSILTTPVFINIQRISVLWQFFERPLQISALEDFINWLHSPIQNCKRQVHVHQLRSRGVNDDIIFMLLNELQQVNNIADYLIKK